MRGSDPGRRLVEQAGVKRIAVLRAGGIGDTLSAMPALRALREKYPEARVCLLTNRLGAGLFWPSDEPPLVDEVLSLDVLFSGGLREFLKVSFWSQLLAYRQWARRFVPDVFVSFHDLFEWRDTLRPAALALLSHAARRLGRSTDGFGWFLTESVPETRWAHRPEYQRNLDVVGLLVRDPGDQTPRLHPRAAAQAWAQGFRSQAAPEACGIATLHILGGRSSRHWPAEQFGELAQWLQSRYGLLPFLIGAPSERPVLERAAQSIPGAGVVVPPHLEATSAWLSQSDLVVGNDSGIVHMAVAVGAPTVSIFGPGEHQLWGYRGLPHYQMVRLQLDCWPCYRFACGDTPCLARLPVCEVAAAVKRVLSDDPEPHDVTGNPSHPERNSQCRR